MWLQNFNLIFFDKKLYLKIFLALIENSPATNWQHCKIMLARVISSNFWDKHVPIDGRQCRHNV